MSPKLQYLISYQSSIFTYVEVEINGYVFDLKSIIIIIRWFVE